MPWVRGHYARSPRSRFGRSEGLMVAMVVGVAIVVVLLLVLFNR